MPMAFRAEEPGIARRGRLPSDNAMDKKRFLISAATVFVIH